MVPTDRTPTEPFLLACASCHAQFDATGVAAASFLCHCGARVQNVRPAGLDAPVRRCSACGASVDGATGACTYCGAILAAGSGPLVCPECYARNPGGAKFCTGCGVAFHPQPVVADGAAAPCPVCEIDLTPRSLAGLAVQECATCRGLWVPAANFDALVARTDTTPPPSAGVAVPVVARPALASPVAYRRCPGCRQLMHRKNFARISGVVIDWCRAHGTWLDAQELEQVARFVRTGGMDRTATLERDESRAAAQLRVLRDIKPMPPANAGESSGLVDLLIGILS